MQNWIFDIRIFHRPNVWIFGSPNIIRWFDFRWFDIRLNRIFNNSMDRIYSMIRYSKIRYSIHLCSIANIQKYSKIFEIYSKIFDIQYSNESNTESSNIEYSNVFDWIEYLNIRWDRIIESSNTELDRISNSIESLKYLMDRIYSVTEYFVLFNDSIFEDRISNYFEYRISGDSVTLI